MRAERLNRARTLIRLAAIAAAVFIICVAALAWTWGSRLIGPVNHPVPIPRDFEASRVSIPGGGHAVAGWWVDRGEGTPVVLLLHAVRADRLTMVPRAQLLLDHGYSVLLIDLQGHGETPGDAITLGYRESADVVAAHTWIQRNTPGRRIGVIGCSLGGASVLLGPQPSRYDAVVLEAVYPRIEKAVENRLRMRVGSLAPVLTPLLLLQLPLRLRISTSDLEPIRSIARLGAPVFIVAGSRDADTTLDESEELFAAASAPKSFWIVTGAKHQDLLAFDPPRYEERVIGFLDRYLKPTGLPHALHNGAEPRRP